MGRLSADLDPPQTSLAFISSIVLLQPTFSLLRMPRHYRSQPAKDTATDCRYVCCLRPSADVQHLKSPGALESITRTYG